VSEFVLTQKNAEVNWFYMLIIYSIYCNITISINNISVAPGSVPGVLGSVTVLSSGLLSSLDDNLGPYFCLLG